MVKTPPIFLIIFLFFFELNGQELKEKDIQKLESFGLEYQKHTEENHDYNNNVFEILKNDRKGKKNKTLGFIIGGLGLLTSTGGILILTGGDENGSLQRTIMGNGTIVLGALEMGVSIPLFCSSKKRKKERDKLIMEINPK